jgi:hypothetical protein
MNSTPQECLKTIIIKIPQKKEPNKTELSLGGLESHCVSPFIKMNINSKYTMSISNFEYHGFLPEFKIINPPMLEESVKWIYPNLHEIEPIWDNSDELPDSSYLELFQKAFTHSLSPLQTDQILSKYDKISIIKCGLSTNKFPLLIEKNPRIAVESIKKLKTSPLWNEYVLILMNMNITLQTVEVMNQISKEISKENLHFYISNAITICDKEKSNHKSRLLGVFLQNVIRKQLIPSTDDIYQIIKAFCVQFTHLKEIQILFQLLDTSK